MARGKHSVALFEVIHNDKRFSGRHGADPMKTPPWWFKNRPTARQAEPVAPATPQPQSRPQSQPQIASPLVVRRAAIAPPAARPAEPEDSHCDEFDPTSEVAARASWNAVSHAEPTSADAHESREPHSAAGANAAMKSLVTRSSAAIIGVAAAAVVAGAVLLGRAHHPQSADGASIPAVIADEPVRPDVIQNLNSNNGPTDLNASAVTPAVLDGRAGNITPVVATIVGPQANARQSPIVVGHAQRQNNLNYVVIQSYADEKLANEACTFLNTNGIGATVEHGLTGWGHMYAVLGVDGFTHTSSGACRSYMQKIRALSRQFAPSKSGHGESYKAFDPIAMKWNHAQ